MFSGGLMQTTFQVLINPDYVASQFHNDVGLVYLGSPVGLSAAVQTIRLPSFSQIGQTFAGAVATVSGWGETGTPSSVQNVLRFGIMRIISNDECASHHGTGLVNQQVLCAVGFTTPNQGHCGGDSGGPLSMFEQDGIRTLVGTVSFWAVAGCDVGLPSGYMRTSQFLLWILTSTGIPIRP